MKDRAQEFSGASRLRSLSRTFVMAGLCPGHPRLLRLKPRKTWMPGTKPGHDELFKVPILWAALEPQIFSGAAGRTPPSAQVSSAATSCTNFPRIGRRSLGTRDALPDTEIAARGSLRAS